MTECAPLAAAAAPGRSGSGRPDDGSAPGGLIAAALIVRDEAAYLGACLESIRHVVDDIVVVDTGSVDGTPALAAAHGARVYHRAWENDFAAARNAALGYCRTDWILYIDADERLERILYIDADERLERIERPALVALLAGAPEVAFRLLLRPSAGTTPYRAYQIGRAA